jgi:hypothetical protein
MLVRGEAIEPDANEAAGCFFQFMTAGMPPAEASSFLDEAGVLLERLREDARAGDDDVQEWRSDIYTAVSGHLMSCVHEMPNLRETNWNALLSELGTRLLDDSGSIKLRS